MADGAVTWFSSTAPPMPYPRNGTPSTYMAIGQPFHPICPAVFYNVTPLLRTSGIMVRDERLTLPARQRSI